MERSPHRPVVSKSSWPDNDFIRAFNILTNYIYVKCPTLHRSSDNLSGKLWWLTILSLVKEVSYTEHSHKEECQNSQNNS